MQRKCLKKKKERKEGTVRLMINGRRKCRLMLKKDRKRQANAKGKRK